MILIWNNFYIRWIFFCFVATQRGSWPSHSWGFLGNTRRHTTVGRTPLDEWSARRRNLYLTTHNTHNRQASISTVGFEPTISGRQAAADLRLRPGGHRDRHIRWIFNIREKQFLLRRPKQVIPKLWRTCVSPYSGSQNLNFISLSTFLSPIPFLFSVFFVFSLFSFLYFNIVWEYSVLPERSLDMLLT
jgi:hypothetical protein